jgi:LacI family transcriptional regulator
MTVTQKQIAEKLGVSVTLVSRVLLGKAEEIGISRDTIKRVEQAAFAMGYVRNAAALTLRGKPTCTIGVVVYNFNDLFFGSLIKQIQIQAHKHGYSVLLVGFLNRIPDQQDLAALRKHSIDGLIILGSDMNAKWLESFGHIPATRIGQGSPQEDSIKITLDEDDAAEKLMSHLAACGRKKVAGLSDSRPSALLRQKALKNAAKAAGVELIPAISNEDEYFDAGVQAAAQILQSHPDVSAMACNTDRIALGALSVLVKNGISTPEKILVTGFDDIMSMTQTGPAITTIRQPFEEMVERAFQALMNPSAQRSYCIPGELVVRSE